MAEDRPAALLLVRRGMDTPPSREYSNPRADQTRPAIYRYLRKHETTHT